MSYHVSPDPADCAFCGGYVPAETGSLYIERFSIPEDPERPNTPWLRMHKACANLIAAYHRKPAFDANG